VKTIRIIICLITFCISTFSGKCLFGQLAINATMTPAQLVQNILVQGGLSISNITFTGSTGGSGGGFSQIGSFTNGNTSYLGLTSGIVLSSGYVIHVAAPGNSTGNMSDATGAAGDADLAHLNSLITGATASTFDAAVLEFDFVPTYNTISFSYVFGSEEYPDYVCSTFDDAFGFFLSGPGINGPYSNNSIDIALVPGSSPPLPVAVNTINSGVSGIDAGGGTCTSLAYSSLYIDNLADTNIVFGGMTKVLTASHSVIPCQKYHIKIAVCDVGDEAFDSSVLLGANSFSAGGVAVTSNYSNSSLGNNAIKGCSNGIALFTLPSPATSPDTINYTIGGTAINGVDYVAIPNSIVIQPGQDTASIIIRPVSNTSSGTVLIGTTSSCNTTYDTIKIIPYVPMTPVTTGTATVCPGGPATIGVTNSGGINPYIYTWSDSLGSGTSYKVTPSSTTIYTVTVSDNCQQTATSSVIVTVANNLSVNISPANPAICQGSSVILTASGGAANYRWSSSPGLSDTTGSVVTAIPASTQTYTVTGTSGGCSAVANVTVKVNPDPTISISASANPICNSTSTTVTAEGAYIYSWSGSSGTTNSVIVAPTEITTYTVTGTDINGCSGTADMTINVNPNPRLSITASANSICTGDSATLTVNGANTYLWSNGLGNSNLVTVFPTSTTSYSVVGTDGNGCPGAASLTVTVNPLPVAQILSSRQATCGLDNGSATATGGASYMWNNGQATSTISGLAPNTYSVTVTSAMGCSSSNTLTINNIAGPTVTADFTNENCGHANGTVISMPAGGTQPYSFLWSNGATTQNINNLPAQTYTLTVTDANSCMATASVTLTNIAGPSLLIAGFTNETCTSGNGSITVHAINGLPPFTYLWSNGDTTATAGNLHAGTYTCTVTDSNHCTAENAKTITNSPPPTLAIIGTDSAKCGIPDGSATMNVNGVSPPYTFVWNSSPSQTTQNLLNVQPGTYMVTVTDSIGCTATTNVIISPKSKISATANSTNETCNRGNGIASVNVSGGTGTYNYSWSNGQTAQTAINLTQGSYMVSVYDGGCSTFAVANVMETPGPTAAFTVHPETITLLDGPVVYNDNSTGNIINWFWNFGDGTSGIGSSIQHQYTGIGNYITTLMVTDNNGCTDSTSDTIKIIDYFTFYIPNAFTPNGDNKNELFYPKGNNVDPNNFNMLIYDRWGNLVFNTNKWEVDHSEGWNGTKNNAGTINDVITGVYIYQIQLREIGGYPHLYNGSITLVQ
jgi:gliding motility-associated-like protein